MTLLARVAAQLTAAGITHALIGASALAAAGVSRSTLDIDLLVVDRRSLDDRFWGGLRADGATISIQRGDADDPLAGVVRVTAPGERPVDVVVGRASWQTRALERALPVDEHVTVVRPRDLVLLKLYAGGTQDLWDVRQLLALPGSEQLVESVEADLRDLPPAMTSAWRTVRQD